MKISIYFIFFLFSVSAYGLTWNEYFSSPEGQQLCQSAMKTNGSYTISYHPVIKANQRFFSFSTTKKSKNTSYINYLDRQTFDEGKIIVEDVVRDHIIRDETLFLLAQNKIVAIDIPSRRTLYKVSTQNIMSDSAALKTNYVARSFVIKGDRAFVAHGLLGLSVVDLSNRSIIDLIAIDAPQPESGHTSTLEDIELADNDMAVLALDNLTMASSGRRAFEGYALFDLSKLSPVKFKAIDQRFEALGFPQILSTENGLIVNNSGIIFRYDLNKMWDKRYAVPTKRIWGLPNKGRIMGRPFANATEIFSCIRVTLKPTPLAPQKKAARPFILERKQHKL
jgi:hypothetical protein